MTLHNAWSGKSHLKGSHIPETESMTWGEHSDTGARVHNCNMITSAWIGGATNRRKQTIYCVLVLVWAKRSVGWSSNDRKKTQQLSARIWNWSSWPVINTACTHGVYKRWINEEKVVQSLCASVIYERRRVMSSSLALWLWSSCTRLHSMQRSSWEF